MNKLFPEIEPYSTGFLDVDPPHTLYWEQSGNPDGVPVVFLHGGPGGGTVPEHRRLFDPAHYRIILFDQRGCGRSTPNMCLEHNTRAHLVSDMETLRYHLKIERWHLFGGSWGSTLALSYASRHPEKCLSLTLRGIFLLSQEEVDWFLYGMGHIFPEAFETFSTFIPEDERGDLLRAYYKRMTGPDKATKEQAGLTWEAYEARCASHRPRPYSPPSNEDSTKNAITLGLMEAHYFTHDIIPEQVSLLSQIDRFRHIPATIVQGRYDVICPIKTAYKLHKAWPEAKYVIVPDAGHAMLEPGILSALITATEDLKKGPAHHDI